MSEADVNRLLYVVCVFELRKGEVIIKQGEHAHSMFIVETGSLRVTVGKEKNQIDLPEVGAGEWVGEISLLDPGPASATVRVASDATVLEFSHQALKDFLRTNPMGACALLEALASDLAERLHRTSLGLIESKDGRLVQGAAPIGEQRSWIKDLLGMLLVPLKGKS
ncbi:MAG: cyclic nucleotide-binding domain-containing protein [Verrucomicrobiota bacterium]